MKVTRNEIREALYNKYIAPTKRKRDLKIGIEIEMPIVNLDQEAVSFEVVQEVTNCFIDHFHFQVSGRDDEGSICAAEDTVTGDILSYDCSYNNLELSLGTGVTIGELSERFSSYYQYLQECYSARNHRLTGMGINPYRQFNHNVPIENERYRMLFHHLSSYRNYFNEQILFHRYPMYGTFSSASQVQLDFQEEELLTAIRAFSKIEPVKALLFANSVLTREREDLLISRDMLWENSTHGINPHNVGMFEHYPESIEELLDYLERESLYCVMRNGQYVNFAPISLPDYFNSETITGELFDGEQYRKVEIVPEIGDIAYLRTFKFEDLTFRGTIEFRSVCCQPIADSMTVAAFHLGLKQKLKELDQLMEEDTTLYHHGYSASEMRKILVKRDIPSYIDQNRLYDLAEKLVDLAKTGLMERGYHEEEYLSPLYERIQKRESPAREMLRRMDEGESMEEIILDYGRI